jgi:hypothetical protein
MALDSSLSIGLKEWDVVCRAMESGRQIMLLRKGGILEAIGGFELENPHFLLYPTHLHQNLAMLKPEAHGGFEPASAEPEKITLRAAGEVTDIVQLKNREQMDRLDDEHIWTSPLIDMRFNYRPKNPLYLLLVRVHRLAAPVTVDNTPEYAGCKSWVPLDRPIELAGAAPVLDDTAFERRRVDIMQRLGSA